MPTLPLGRTLALVVLAALAAPLAEAQSAALRGFVTDASDGQPLVGATVLVVQVDEAGERLDEPRGAAADLDGLYVISRLTPGRYAVQASFIGYATQIDTLTLDAGVRGYDIALGLADATLGVAVVESERSTGGARVTAGVQSIDPADIELIPTPDVSGDLASYLTTTPGVVTTGDRGGQLFIRGGEPSQNLVLLDGMAVYQPFHVLGFYSAFPSDILAGADLYAGGYPARFGGQVSSVLDIQSRTGNKQQLAAQGSVAPFVSAAQVEGPLAKGAVSFLASGRVSVVEQGAARIVDQELPYDFGDLFGKVHASVTPTSQLSVTGLRTWDRGTIGEDFSDLDENLAPPQEVRYTNTAIGLRFLYLPSVAPLRAEILANVSELDSEQGERETPIRASAVGRLSFEANLTNYLGATDLNYGAFIRTNRLRSSLTSFDAETSEFYTEAGAYLEPEVRVGGLALQGGLRIHSFPNDGRTYLEPRAKFVLDVGPHQFSGAGGSYHQEVVGINDRRDVANVFTAWTRAPDLLDGNGETIEGVVSAWHAIGGYKVAPTSWFELVAEGYYKALDNVPVARWTSLPEFTTDLQPASGEVLGLDTRVEFRLRDVYAYLGYGLSSVTYEALPGALPSRYRDEVPEGETFAYRPPHDRRHQITALLSGTVGGFELSARWQFGSGLPYTRALGFDVFLNPGQPFSPFDEAGQPRVIYERPFDGRLPTFHRLDLSAERTFDLGAAALTVQGALINAYDRANLFYFDTFTLRRVDQLPIIPSVGVKVAFND
ncbi:MAG: TonB-dependent receptor [Bacteroidota bacterium]